MRCSESRRGPLTLATLDLSPRAGRGAIEIRSRGAIAPESCRATTTHQKDAHDPEKWSPVFGSDHAPRKRERSADRRTIHCPRHIIRCCHLNYARARKRALSPRCKPVFLQKSGLPRRGWYTDWGCHALRDGAVVIRRIKIYPLEQ
jgi:hypothetical protein